jgi:hypothetical protein
MNPFERLFKRKPQKEKPIYRALEAHYLMFYSALYNRGIPSQAAVKAARELVEGEIAIQTAVEKSFPEK